MRLKAPDRSDLMPELVAAALDTAFAVRRRFGRMASGVHTITIDDGAGGMDDHMTAGSTQGRYRHHLPRHQPRVRRRDRRPTGSVAVAGGGCRRRCPAPGSTSTASSPTRYWHNLDATVVTTPGVYVEFNRALGEELGVETFEHALRGRDAGRAARAGAPDSVGSSPRCRRTRRRTCARRRPSCSSCGGARRRSRRRHRWLPRFGALLDRYYPPR